MTRRELPLPNSMPRSFGDPPTVEVSGVGDALRVFGGSACAPAHLSSRVRTATDSESVSEEARAGARVQLGPMKQEGSRDSLALSAHHPVEVPAVRDALQFVPAGVLEGEASCLLYTSDAADE